MATLRYTVLMARDLAGGWSAISLDVEKLSGFGKSSSDARHDIRELLEYKHKKEEYVPTPDFENAELGHVRVEIRTEYQASFRVYPTSKKTSVKVPYVKGLSKSGQKIAALPFLDIRFAYYEDHELDGLLKRYAILSLEKKTPAELARLLPPKDLSLEDVIVSIPRKTPEAIRIPPPPSLTQIAEALNDRGTRQQYSRAYGRETELATVVEKIFKEKANVLLVGESGVGKTSLLIDAAKEVEKRWTAEAKAEKLPAPPYRFWITSGGRIIAGMKYLGQWEERVEEVISDLGSINGVLCVDRLLDLVRNGGRGPTDSIAAFLMPYLVRGELRMCAETTPAELDALRRLLPGFADLFQIVIVPAFNREQTLVVLDRLLATAQTNYKLESKEGVSDRIIQLFRRFQPYAAFPGTASTFLRSLMDKQARKPKRIITPDDVVEAFRKKTGLPETFLRDEILLEKTEVENWFTKKVIDQPEGIAAATHAVLTLKAGLNDPNRPLAVLLLCGPTGVGKTELAKSLAQYFYGAGETSSNKLRMVRLDMSEYAGFDAASRLVGPPGGDPSQLIQKVRQQPFTVVLFDEIEKASPEVFDVLLGVFDEGRLTDPYGRVTDFRSTLIIMTSNIGADRQESFGFDPSGQGPKYSDIAMSYFRPEFFNRLDEVVTFYSLKPHTIEAVTCKELEELSLREGIASARIKLLFTDRLIKQLAKVGFDARYGARPLQRTIEKEVVVPLSAWLINEPGLTDKTLQLDWDTKTTITQLKT